jgi:hypothetical protein
MVSIQQLQRELQERLDGSPVAKLCVTILDYADRQRPENLAFLTYTSLAKAAGSSVEDPLLVAAIHVLEAGPRDGLLDKHYLFRDGSGKADPIPDSEAREAFVDGEIVLWDGSVVSDVDNYLIPYFSASRCLLAAKKGAE